MMTPMGESAATELHLDAGLRGELSRLAVKAHPKEACGLLVGRAGEQRIEVERVFPARNLNRDRAGDRYELDPDDFLAADKAARAADLEIVGIWHSHPDCPARPSSTDREAAWEGYSYLIVAVTAAGDTDLRCWRLDPERFRQERIVPEVPATPVPELRFDRPLKEEKGPAGALDTDRNAG